MERSSLQNKRVSLPFRFATASRKTTGVLLLLFVVILWVASSFLVSTIYYGEEYSKTYLVTYINTSTFALYLIPFVARKTTRNLRTRASVRYDPIGPTPSDDILQQQSHSRLNTRETFKLAAEFCILWFTANWLGSACLRFTSVASVTILSSLSSVFCFIVGYTFRVEGFSYSKLAAVIMSLAGITLVATIDVHSSPNPDSKTPDSSATATVIKTISEILLGDLMALLGAFFYGLYTVLLKVRIGHESRVDMQLFFGFVGLINLCCLWPGIILLDWLSWEMFELPPNRKVLAVVMINACITLVSDFAWCYAMLLTSPVIVTVGMGISIPISLAGQMILQGKQSSFAYWVGAILVFVSFFFISSENVEETPPAMGRNSELVTESEIMAA